MLVQCGYHLSKIIEVRQSELSLTFPESKKTSLELQIDSSITIILYLVDTVISSTKTCNAMIIH